MLSQRGYNGISIPASLPSGLPPSLLRLLSQGNTASLPLLCSTGSALCLGTQGVSSAVLIRGVTLLIRWVTAGLTALCRATGHGAGIAQDS